MKKLFSIIFAGMIALMAVSCVEEELATFDPSNATAPVMGSTEVGAKQVSVAYSPAVMKLGFNEKIAPNHALALVSVDGNAASKIVTTSNDGSTLTASIANISKALMTLGYAEGDVISSIELAVRATLQTLSQDNGVNGYIDSEGRLTINNFTVTIPQGSPYADYTETSTWSVIGALSEYGISWDGDLEVFATSDGNHLVAKAVKLTADDEFKFRKDQDWAVNMGGTFGSLDTAFPAAQDGPNVKVGTAGTYDLWLDLDASTITVTDAYFAYPDHKDASNWGVTGALSEYGISWDGDIAMITDGTTHVAQGVKLKAADEFKFRKDADWAENFGGTFGSLGTPFEVTNGGPNIIVGADGIYDLILDPSGSATVVETLGGGASGKIGGNEPDEPDEPTTYTGWGIIGVGGDWENDVAMTESDGIWTGYATIAATDSWKLRKDAGWDENYGGPGEEEPYVITLDTPLAGVAGGKNLAVPADGFYKVTLNAETGEITVSEGDVWGVIGQFNGWAGDAFMTLTDGKWVSPEISLVAGEGFKIRYNAGWDVNRGAEGEVEPYVVTLGQSFPVAAGGKNLAVEADGNYIVTYDPAAETITVSSAIPSNLWSVIGTVAGSNWDKDFYMTETNGVWVSDLLTINAGDGFKVRYNNDWGENRGAPGDTEPFAIGIGDSVEATAGGKNLTVKEDGEYRLVYDSGRELLYLVGWTVIGQVNGSNWNMDVLMHPVGEGKWESEIFSAEGGFKIRYNMGWDVNRGAEGDTEPYIMTSCTAITGVAGGKNLGVDTSAGLYWKIVYDSTTESITVHNCSWSVIGQVNGANWDKDVAMCETEAGTFTSDPFTVEGGFKIRFNHGWDVNRGAEGDTEPYNMTLGTAITGVANGKNLGLESPSGQYVITYVVATESITINSK